MSITAQYTSEPTNQLVGGALAGATFMPGGGHADATFSFWAYQQEAGDLAYLGHAPGVAAVEIFTSVASGTRLWLWDDGGGSDGFAWQAHGALLNQWVHWAVVIDQSGAGQIRMYRNGVAMASVTMALAGWTPRTAAGDAARFHLGAVAGDYFANLHVQNVALTAAQIAAIAAAPTGWQHNLRDDTGAWTAADPGVVAWEVGARTDGKIPNTGTGAQCFLQAYDGAYIDTTVEEYGAVPYVPTPVAPLYPPVRFFYRLPGTAGNYLKTATSRIADYLFPNAGGGLGDITFRVWMRRPLVPSVADGTFLWISKGDAWLRALIDLDGDVTVTVNDGNGVEVTGSTTGGVPGLSNSGGSHAWVPVVISVIDPNLNVWVGPEPTIDFSVGVGTIDVDAVIPDGPVIDFSFRVGTNGDDTDPIDLDVGNIGIWAFGWIPDDIETLIVDPYRPPQYDPTTDPPVIVWVGIGVPEVPDEGDPASGDPDPLVPVGDVEAVTEPSTFHAWFSGDHRIGVMSSAWWPESAHDPDVWTLAFVTAAHADTFGECPRVVVITLRDDGALILDLDARAIPGISYTLTGPADLTGEVP